MIKLSVDATSVEIEQISDDDLEELSDALSFRPQGYVWTKAYKSGRWDGRIRLIYSPSGMRLFSPGFLHRAEQLFPGEIEITEDTRPVYEKTEFCKPTFELREFQGEAIDLIMRHKRGVLQAPPRAGKTRVAAELYRRTSLSPFLFLTWKKEEAKQTRRAFEEVLPGAKVGIIADGVCDIEDKDIVVATVASLAWANDLITRDREKTECREVEDFLELPPKHDQYKLIRRFCESAKVVVWDEAHHAATDIDRFLSQRFSKAEFVLGLSGTPWRDDHKTILIEEVIGPILFQMSYEEAVAAGIILPLQVTAFYLPDFDYIIKKGYPEAYRKAITDNEWYHEFVHTLVEYHRGLGETVAIIVNQIKHGQRLERLIPASRFLHGKTSNADREKGFQSIADRDGTCLISTLIDEALDLPALDVVIVADVRKGSTKAFQRIRSMTVDAGKEFAQLVCFVPPVPHIQEHGQRVVNLLRSEGAFEVYKREVYENGKVSRAKRLKQTKRRSGRDAQLAVLPGATEDERRAAREGR